MHICNTMHMSSTTVYFDEEANGLYSRHCAAARALRDRVTLFTGGTIVPAFEQSLGGRMPDQIVAGREIEEDLTGGKRLRPDFCIIGSGAGGGVCALILAQAGFDVLVLEEGPNIPPRAGRRWRMSRPAGPCRA